MTLDEIRAALYDRVLVRAAERSGVSVRVLYNIQQRKIDHVSKRTMEKLVAYLTGAK